jgi:hypothetical protein
MMSPSAIILFPAKSRRIIFSIAFGRQKVLSRIQNIGVQIVPRADGALRFRFADNVLPSFDSGRRTTIESLSPEKRASGRLRHRPGTRRQGSDHRVRKLRDVSRVRRAGVGDEIAVVMRILGGQKSGQRRRIRRGEVGDHPTLVGMVIFSVVVITPAW